MSALIAKVAVSKATYWIDKPYDYLVPEDYTQIIQPGIRVKIPFSRNDYQCEGVVLSVYEEEQPKQLKTITEILDGSPVLTDSQIKMALFMRSHFFCTVYDAVRAILPAGMLFGENGKRKIKDAYREIAVLTVPSDDAYSAAELKSKKAPMQAAILEVIAGFGMLPVEDLLLYTGASRTSLKAVCDLGYITVDKQEIYRKHYDTDCERVEIPPLNCCQSSVYSDLKNKLLSREYSVSLLFGVTGSGKTLVYSKLIQDCLNMGKSAILLVPEISLTPQAVATFSSFFGNQVAVLHSSLSAGERYDEWKRIKKGKARVIIGTRSAVFAPADQLGLIIIDEEHEESYKSEASPRYNARDIAKYRCFISSCMLLLGSATPDVVSMYHAKSGGYSLHSLPERYNNSGLPFVRTVDMKDELRNGNSSDISSVLAVELQKNISAGEQSIIFLNRRGTNKLITCTSCGFVYQCPRCSVALTYHGIGNRLICHSCGYSRKVDSVCPECGGDLDYFGSGTQRIVEELHDLFPETEILRMDADSLSLYGSHDVLFNQFIENKIPVLVGTQMIGKGLNFENVTLVGVISADQSLYSGDYRAAERTFSILTQVIGRCGRGKTPGRAVIQTFTPDNPVIRYAAEQDFNSFYDYELEFRRVQHMPPFYDFLRIVVLSDNEQMAAERADNIAFWLKNDVMKGEDAFIFGPAPLSVAKVNNCYRFSVGISCHLDNRIRNMISNLIISCKKDKRFRDVSVFADSNPL